MDSTDYGMGGGHAMTTLRRPKFRSTPLVPPYDLATEVDSIVSDSAESRYAMLALMDQVLVSSHDRSVYSVEEVRDLMLDLRTLLVSA